MRTYSVVLLMIVLVTIAGCGPPIEKPRKGLIGSLLDVICGNTPEARAKAKAKADEAKAKADEAKAKAKAAREAFEDARPSVGGSIRRGDANRAEYAGNHALAARLRAEADQEDAKERAYRKWLRERETDKPQSK